MIKDGKPLAIFKAPKTDSQKRSAKGLLQVVMQDGELVLRDDVSVTEEAQGLLQTVYEDGKLLRETNLPRYVSG